MTWSDNSEQIAVGKIIRRFKRQGRGLQIRNYMKSYRELQEKENKNE